ncbi:MAG: hypothetical protein U1F68_07870 [Gammaproteobacteria bacterium]
MCGLCGVLGGGQHWADSAGKSATFGQAAAQTRMAERARRIALVNQVLRHYGLLLSDWGGHSYVLRNLTGQSKIVESLADLWNEAEKLAHRRCDPLAPTLVAELRRST